MAEVLWIDRDGWVWKWVSVGDFIKLTRVMKREKTIENYAEELIKKLQNE